MIEITTSPTGLPVSLSEAKRHLGITDDTHDVDIERLIRAGSNYLIRSTGRSLLVTGYTLTLGCVPPDRRTPIELPYPPLSVIGSINYYDESGSVQALSTYQVVKSVDTVAKIYPDVGGDWPTVESDRVNALTIVYTAGYADADAIPDEAKLYIKEWARNHYDNADGLLDASVAAGLSSLANSLWVGNYADPGTSPY